LELHKDEKTPVIYAGLLKIFQSETAQKCRNSPGITLDLWRG